MSDLGKNIQRIANTDELQRQINELQSLLNASDKPPIKGSRTTTYTQPGGSIGTNKGDSGAAQFKNEFDGAMDALGGDLADNTDSGNNSGGTGELLDPTLDDAFELSAQDIHDGNIEKGAKITGLDGLKDCATGDLVEINLMDQFTPPAYGDTFEGYNADTDPREGQFVQGTHYEYTALTLHRSTSVYGAVSAGLSELDSNDPGNAPHTIVSIPAYDENALTDGVTIAPTLNRVAGQFQVSVSARVGICSVGVDAWCPSTAPINDWDADGIHQLAFDGAQFKTHENEATADEIPRLLNNPSSIDLCTSDGSPVTLSASGDGGITMDFGSGDVYRAKASSPGNPMTITEVPGDFTIP